MRQTKIEIIIRIYVFLIMKIISETKTVSLTVDFVHMK